MSTNANHCGASFHELESTTHYPRAMTFGRRRTSTVSPQYTRSSERASAPRFSKADVRFLKEVIAALIVIIGVGIGFYLHNPTIGGFVGTLRQMNRLEIAAVLLGISCPWVIIRYTLGLSVPRLRRRTSDDGGGGNFELDWGDRGD